MITDVELQQLQRIIFEDYGVKLSIDEARLMADRLVGMYEALFSAKGSVYER